MTTLVVNNSVFRGLFEKPKLTGPKFIDRNLENLGAYDMLQELKTLFSQQAEQELLQTVREFHACKQKGHSEYDNFVQHYNMHGMRKTVNELHAMLKLHDQTLPKKDAHALHIIKAGKRNCPRYLSELLKNKKLSRGARTSGDDSKPSHEGYRNTIELSVKNNVVPLRSDTIRLVQNGCSFHGLRSEDPNQHLKDFLKLVDSLDLDTWTRFKDLLHKVPHHGIDLKLQVQFFYDHVNLVTRRTIDQSAGGKLRDHNAKESWALLEYLALYDNESWNDPRDFTKSVKAITLPQDVPSTSDPYNMENPEQAFVDYASSRNDEAKGYPKETIGYCFYYPPENKVFVARNAEFLDNSLITQEASGSLDDLEDKISAYDCYVNIMLLFGSDGCDMKSMQNVPYASAVGSISYAVRCTRPDVAFAQNITNRFQHNPGEAHWTISCYTDAGYLTDADDLESQIGYVFVLNGGAVNWKSSKQSIFATSSAEAEYIAASDTSKKAIWVKKFIYGESRCVCLQPYGLQDALSYTLI
uniref:Retrovirus-related Pol polyprotein from transposon TNT 1-94 n=1 Tax=Tanacetum cinerariifolium TaxID=118510 RepID=A0A6L2NDA7_TANCI|nr:retrovirus-related Pol polyprotein from transposon TNT 1-94 [Tanacetum cinerariifolium]